MGIRSDNYIALKPSVSLPENIKQIFATSGEMFSTANGSLFLYETNFTPMYARDGRGENCTSDLEEEIAIQRFLGSLPVDSFFMRRAGEQCDHRGAWALHPFQDNASVKAVEATYLKETGQSPVFLTVGDFIATLPLLRNVEWDADVLNLPFDSNCGADCVAVLKGGEALASICGDTNTEILEATVQQVNIFYFG